MVWRKASQWVIETHDGKYRIEKFATGEDILEFPAIFRYRILKILSEWYFELAPSEICPEAAKQVCQAHAAAEAK